MKKNKIKYNLNVKKYVLKGKKINTSKLHESGVKWHKK